MDQLVQVAQFITSVSVPACLKRPEFEFCKVGYTKATLAQLLPGLKADKEAKSILEQFKRPRGDGWQTNTFRWDSPGLQEWVKLGGNYGIVAGGSWEYDGQHVKLFIMDADNPPAIAETGFEDDLPRDTFRVKTGRIDPAPGLHFYFLSDITSTKAHIELPDYCHFKFYHSQCVGPGSLHPSGRRYELLEATQPAYVDAETLSNALITTTQVLCPDKAKDVRDALGVKVTPHGQRLDANVKRLEELKQEKIKQIQQREAQSEIAYNAIKGRNKEQVDISQDERINPCLKRLTANIFSGKASRFEQVVAYQGKVGEGEHALRLAWATALVKAGYDDDVLHLIAQHFDDYTESRTQQQIASVKEYVDKGGDYHPCKTLKAYIPPDWCKGCRWTPPEPDRSESKKEQSSKDLSRNVQVSSFDTNVMAQAQEIINNGEFIDFWVKVFQRRHNGDTHIPLAMLAANLTPNISNSHGVAVLQVAGESGDGKSHAVQTVAEQMGQWCDISGLSPMALLYHAGKTVHGGMMVVMDDNRPDERQGDIIKRAQTQFKSGYRYKTIVKGKPVELQMPPGVQLLTTEVDADSEDQVLNRTLMLEVQGSPEKDLAIIEDDLSRLETGDQPLDDPDITICQAGLDALKAKTYIVTIPEAKKRIKWVERNKDRRANLRNYNIFVDLVQAVAVMRWPKRTHYEDESEILHIEATKQDFMEALALYHAIHRQMKTKLTSKELELLSKVKNAGGRIQKDDAQKEMGISRQRLDALCRGKNGQGGLLGKYPGFFIEESVENEVDRGKGAGDYTTRHVKRKYLCLTNVDIGQARVDGSNMAAEWVEDQPPQL